MTRSGERAAKTVHDPAVGVAGRRGRRKRRWTRKRDVGEEEEESERKIERNLDLGEEGGRSSRHPVNPKLSSFAQRIWRWISADFCRLTARSSAQRQTIIVNTRS